MTVALTMTIDHPPEDADAVLLARWRDHHDRAALATLAERLIPPGWRAARAFAPAQAEDVLQDAFLALTTGVARWRGGDVRSWFVGIVVHTAQTHRRRQRRRNVPLPPEPPTTTPDDGGLAERVLAAVSRLPEHERVPLWLHVVEEMECQAIAAQLRRPPGTVRAQVARALERLRGWFGSGLGIAVVAKALHHAAWAEPPSATVAAHLATAAADAPTTTTTPGLATMVGIAAVGVMAIVALLVAGVGVPPPEPAEVVPEPAPEPAAQPSMRIIGTGPFQHTDSVNAAALSPDGLHLATASGGGIVIWDLAEERVLLRIDTGLDNPFTVLMPDRAPEADWPERLEGEAVQLAWLPDGHLVGTVRMPFPLGYLGRWKADDGALVRRWPVGDPDGTMAVLGNLVLVPGSTEWESNTPDDGVIAIDLDQTTALPPLSNVAPVQPGRTWSVMAVAIHPGGRHVACLCENTGTSGNGTAPVFPSDDAVVSVWSWPERRKLAERPLQVAVAQGSVCWLDDGRLQVTGVRHRDRREVGSLTLAADLQGEPEFAAGHFLSAPDGSRLHLGAGWAEIVAADGSKQPLQGWPPDLHHPDGAVWRPEGHVIVPRGTTPTIYDLAARRLRAPAPDTLADPPWSLVWLPDRRLLVSNFDDTLVLDNGRAPACRLPGLSIPRAGSGDSQAGDTWGWRDGRLHVLARRAAGGERRRSMLLDPETGRTNQLPPSAASASIRFTSRDLRHAFAIEKEGETCSVVDLVTGATSTWRHPDLEAHAADWFAPALSNVLALRWHGDLMLIADYAHNDESLTGVWTIEPVRRERRFLHPDGTPILTAIDVVPHPDGEWALVVPNDAVGQRAWLCRIADGTCVSDIPNPGGGAIWTADGAIVTGRLAAVSVPDRRAIVTFSERSPELATADRQGFSNGAHFGVAIGHVQPSPTGTQVAVYLVDRLAVLDTRTGATVAEVPFPEPFDVDRERVPANSRLAAWSPGEDEVALTDGATPVVLVATLAALSADPVADRAVLRDTARPLDERRAALAKLEAAARAGIVDALPKVAGDDALLTQWLEDARQRARPIVPPSSGETAAPADSGF